MKFLATPVLVLCLVVGGCASTAFGKWAQLQKAYNTTVQQLNNYRRPCVDQPQGEAHPLCLIKADDYTRINTYVQQARVALDNALVNAEAGGDLNVNFWLGEAERLITVVLAQELARATAGN